MPNIGFPGFQNFQVCKILQPFYQRRVMSQEDALRQLLLSQGPN
jgi:hypothetical protein